MGNYSIRNNLFEGGIFFQFIPFAKQAFLNNCFQCLGMAINKTLLLIGN